MLGFFTYCGRAPQLFAGRGGSNAGAMFDELSGESNKRGGVATEEAPARQSPDGSSRMAGGEADESCDRSPLPAFSKNFSIWRSFLIAGLTSY